jgi:hypothetical protein
MRSRSRVFGLLLVLGLSLDPLAAGEPPDPAIGSIKKYLPEARENALILVPGRFAGGRLAEVLNPAGLEAHFALRDDPDVELVYPAGSWVEPPSGQYRYWLQGDWVMTPYAGLLSFSGQGSMQAVLMLGEAGRVTLREEDMSPGLELRLLHAGSYLEGPFLRWEISPRRAADEIGDGVLLPVGKAIGALWDPGEKKYVALSRPFEVRSRRTVKVPLHRPAGGIHLMAEMRRRSTPSSEEDPEVAVALRRDGGDLPPDLKVLTADKIYAAWYGLAPGQAELRVKSGQTFFHQKMDLVPGIEWVEGRLEPRPALDVKLDLPALLRRGKLVLEVLRLPSGEPVDRHVLEKGMLGHRFEGLPPALLAVDLQTSLGTFTRQVDLSSNQDEILRIKPELMICWSRSAGSWLCAG